MYIELVKLQAKIQDAQHSYKLLILKLDFHDMIDMAYFHRLWWLIPSPYSITPANIGRRLQRYEQLKVILLGLICGVWILPNSGG